MIGNIQNQTGPCVAIDQTGDQLSAKFEKLTNAAQQKDSDYSNVVQVARGISLAQAMTIADINRNVDYFCFTKGGCMVLETSPHTYKHDPFGLVSYRDYITDAGKSQTGHARIFRHGDAVFFSNEVDGVNKKALGSAPGLSDTYIKI